MINTSIKFHIHEKKIIFVFEFLFWKICIGDDISGNCEIVISHHLHFLFFGFYYSVKVVSRRNES